MDLYKVVKNVRYPWRYINALNRRKKIRKYLPDSLVIRCRFRESFERPLNLKNPQTFNEKLQWIKLYDRNPKYCQLVDKYEVKRIVGSLIGEKHIIPTYGVWDHADDIDFQSLPDSFVLKTTHDSHGIFICKRKEELNVAEAKDFLTAHLKNNYYLGGREWPYKYVQPRIIAEEYLSESENGLTDYKIHCFNGEPRFILVCTDRFSDEGMKEVFYDLNWNKMEVARPGINIDGIDIPRPQRLDEMISYAGKLAAGIPFVRVDFYQYEGNTYFGEMTFFPAGGYKRFVPDKYDKIFGDLISLDLKNKYVEK